MTLGRPPVSPGVAGRSLLSHRAPAEGFPKPKLFLDLNPRCVALGFGCSMSSARAIRYRKLALAQQDKVIADLLLKLADECDRGILCTAEWRSACRSAKLTSRRKQRAPNYGLSGRHLTDVENLVPSRAADRDQGGGMTDDQVNRIVQHLCQQLHLAIRLKGSEAHPPNAKDIGFDPASVNTVLRTGFKLAGVAVADPSLTDIREES